MKPKDHSECDPAECIHAREVLSEAAFDKAYGGPSPEREAAYYEQKRRMKLSGPEVQGLSPVRETSFPKFGDGDGQQAYGADVRRQRLLELEMAVLAQREQMIRSGDPMPLQDVRNVIGDALRLLEAKQEKYGNAWRAQGYMGNLARIQSKAERLKNMLWQDADGNGYPLPANTASDAETVLDTLLDLINLSAFMAINWTEENRWGRS